MIRPHQIEKIRILNAFVRILSLIFKFIFVIFLAKNFQPEQVGEFNKYFYIVTLLAYILGMNFFTFNTREIVAAEQKLILIRSQLIYQISTFIITIPFMFVIFNNLFELKKGLFLILLVLTLLELLTNEISRIFIALQKQLYSTILITLKSGFWGGMLVIYWIIFDKSFSQIFTFWAGSLLFGTFMSIIILEKINKNIGVKIEIKNINWFFSGVRKSALYFLNGIFAKIIEYSAILMLAKFIGTADFGVYTFFFSLQAVALTIVYATCTSFYTPTLLSCVDDNENFNGCVRSMWKSTLFYSTLVFVLSLIAIFPVLLIVDKVAYWNRLEVYFILGFGFFFMNLSTFYSTFFYVIGEDRYLFKVNSLMALFCIVVSFVFVTNFQLGGASVAHLLCSGILFLLFYSKYQSVKKAINYE